MNKNKYKNVAVIVAAGSSIRTKMYTSVPKQYFVFKGKPILQHTLDVFLNHHDINGIILVVNKLDYEFYQPILEKNSVLKCVYGGDKRQDSVFAALCAAEQFNPLNILIHDGVRPFVTDKIISLVIEELNSNDGVVPVSKISESIGYTDGEYMTSMLDRSSLRLMQTPQSFRYKLLFELYKKEINGSYVFTDEVNLMCKHGHAVKTILGSIKNMKITFPQDIQMLCGITPDLFDD